MKDCIIRFELAFIWKNIAECLPSIVGRFYFWIAQNVISRIVGMIYIAKISGRENLPRSGPFIVAPNHISYLDFMFVMASIPKKMHFFVKSRYYDSRLWHHILKTADQIKADKIGLRWGAYYLKRGKIVVIYPEGTRSKTGKLGKGMFGVATLSIDSCAPVIPLVINDSFKLQIPGQRYPKLFHTVRLHFCKPIDPTSYRREEKQKFVNDVMEGIQTQLEKRSKQE